MAIAGHTSTLGSSPALLLAVSTSQALLLVVQPARPATHATRYFSPTLLFVGPMDPDDVCHCRNLRPAICWAIPVWRYAGRRGGTCGGDVRNVFDYGLREVSFPLRTWEVFWTAR